VAGGGTGFGGFGGSGLGGFGGSGFGGFGGTNGFTGIGRKGRLLALFIISHAGTKRLVGSSGQALK
jgi:hypothetical protein